MTVQTIAPHDRRPHAHTRPALLAAAGAALVAAAAVTVSALAGDDGSVVVPGEQAPPAVITDGARDSWERDLVPPPAAPVEPRDPGLERLR